MGDLIEFTTKADCEFIFHHITTGAVRFSIKGAGDAAIILARNKIIANNDYWFNIGMDQKSWIGRCGKTLCEAKTPDVLSAEEYRDFYISWINGYAELGRVNQPPFIKEKIDTTSLGYVAFVTTRKGLQLHWKCHMPPKIPKPVLVKISGGEPKWIKVVDHLPDDVICGGFENELIYIIRASHRGSLTPGKFVPSEGMGYIPWDGRSHDKVDFEALCGTNYTWLLTRHNKIPVGAVQAGYSEDHNNETLYVGRAKLNGHLIVGKVQPSHKVCYVPYDGREVAKSEYEILVVPYANRRSAKEHFIAEPGVTLAVQKFEYERNIETSSDSEDYNIYLC